MTRRLAPLVGWLAFLAVALAVVHDLGDGALATPPLHDLDGWLERTGPPAAAFAVLRLVTLGLGWYLLGSTALALGLRLLRVHGAADGVEARAPRLVRRLVRGAVGLTIATGAMTSAAGGDDAPVAMRRLPDGPIVTPAEVRQLDEQPPVTMRRLDDAGAAAPAPGPPVAGRETWTVSRGDSFWLVARRVLSTTWQRPVTDDQIDPYWRALVQANRSRLADPENPDLLFPEQVLDLPTPPSAPAP